MTQPLKALRFLCPDSGHEIESDFRADAHTLSMVRLFSVRLRCDACGTSHEFKMDEALPFRADDEWITPHAQDRRKGEV